MSLILQARGIKKQYGTRTVLDFESFPIYEGNKIGIVGANGAGKTTLFEILSGEMQPDEGVVDRSCRVAYIRQFEESADPLSGGEKVKLRIQKEIGRENTIIMADEPTANLDREGIRWLQGLLRKAGTVLLISHDRELLDDICDRIVEIRDGKLFFYTGNYTDYSEQVRVEHEQQQQKYEEYRRKKIQLEAAVEQKERKLAQSRQRKKKDYQINSSEAILYKGSRAAKQKKVEQGKTALSARLDRLEKVDKVRELPKIRMDFSLTDPPRNKIVISGEDLCFSYGDKVILDHAAFSVPCNERVAVTGKNGAGKTTLLRLIYEGYPGISRAPRLKPGWLYQGFENLDPDKTVLESALRDSVQSRADVCSILAGLLFYGDSFGKKVSALSGGERMRLSLAMLIASDCNALFLDEPTNYLDIRSVEAVENMIREYPGTVLIVSHDERFLRRTTNMELRLENGIISRKEPGKAAKKPPVQNRMLLEMRRTALVSAISSAPPEQKDILEREYAQVLSELQNSV